MNFFLQDIADLLEHLVNLGSLDARRVENHRYVILGDDSILIVVEKLKHLFDIIELDQVNVSTKVHQELLVRDPD